MSEVNSWVPDAVLLADSEAAFIDAERFEVGKILPHALGDFGGALSWPVPLSVDQQKEVLNAVRIYIASLEDRWKPGQGLLEYLNLAQPLASEILLDPAKALEALIASPRGQALGLAVQTHLKGISTDASVNEYALAALQLNLDPLSIENPQRNSVAGFDLADKQHWGKPVSSVFKKLREHLIKELFSNPEMAGLGAHLLLARNAPLYLIKDIPDGVKYGGPAWFNLAVATETIEAQSPGKVANLSFAQVMICAESAALVDPAVTRHAQTITLIDWGVIHGLVERESDESYTEVQLSELKTRFNDELADRLNTPILLSSVFPSRMDIARAGLEKQFGKNYPIEKHVLEWEGEVEANLLTILSPLPSATVGPVGMHTLLDVAMMDGSYKWKTSDPLLKYRIYEINELDLRVQTTFNSQFEATLNNLKEGARLTFQHLVSELPLEDRENLEYGKIDFYQNKTFRLSTGFYGRSVIFTSPRLTLRVERGIEKKVSVYCIDLTAGSITKKESDPATETDQVDRQVPSIVYATTPFYLADQKLSRKLRQRTTPAWAVPVPVSYSSARTRILADAFVEHLDYDSEDILSAAEGQTTYDKQVAVLNSRVDFLLNLIPFKSAITHFIEGKHVDGAIDLFLDVLGFVTAGVGAVAKLAQVAVRTASAISKALRAAKIIGVLVIGELNPLNAVLAGGQLLGKGIKYLGVKGLHQLKRISGIGDAYDLLQAASKDHGPALMGTFKIGEQSIEGVGVLKEGNWYQYNARTNRLYGAPGEFLPKLGRVGLGGFVNKGMSRFAVESSAISGLKANAQGIFRSADQQRFYIRNIDATGKEAVYRIKNDYNLSGDVDVIIVNSLNNAQGSRLWQVAPDQWQPKSILGGEILSDSREIPVGVIVDESASLVNSTLHTSTNPLNLDVVFVRERLPNGLWEPVIETVSSTRTAHLPIKSSPSSYVSFSLQSTSIHQALSPAELSRFAVVTDLLQPNQFKYSDLIVSQLETKNGGANFTFVMDRIQPADNIGGEFNSLRIHDTHTEGLVKHANAVNGYWAPQGGYVDIPAHPEWGQPDYLFTPGFSGCSLVVDQMGANQLRVRHVEGAKELAQYNGLPREEHGWGLSAAMESHEYALRLDQNGNADAILTGFAFMKYDRTTRSWKLHFQSTQEAPRIARYSAPLPKGARQLDPLVEIQSGSRVTKVVTKAVSTTVGAMAA